jgi:predicted HTH domain antitoxin
MKVKRMSELRFEAPVELVTALQELGDPDLAAKECVVLELYRRGAISSGKAAELLGMERLEFIRYSGRLGIPYFRLSAEELAGELQQLRAWNKP